MENKIMKTVVEPTRPLQLGLRYAKRELVDAVNKIMKEHHLPAYLFRGILAEVLTSVEEVERREIEMAELQYQKDLDEFNKSK